jgi:choline-sulfatase
MMTPMRQKQRRGSTPGSTKAARHSQPPRRPRRPTGWRLALGATALVLAAVAAWVWLRPALPGRDRLNNLVHPGDAKGYNVLVVTLDTVRWDHLGCYGSADARTPNFDSLTEHGIRFEQAVASTPLTLPSHATILTGLDPPAHGARDNGRYQVRPEVETLAESFRNAGYRTAAFVSCFVLDERYGLSQGFDRYDFQVGSGRSRPQMADFNERSAGETSDAAIAWLQDASPNASADPFLLWIHYFDPHRPYQSPLQGQPEFKGRPYDAEIAYVDREFGRVLGELDRLGVRDRTLIVLVADHGESLGEHEESAHGMFIYDATVRVPLIISCPGLFPRAAVERDRVAGQVDIAPTLRDLCGLPVVATDGHDWVQAAPAAARSVYMETLAPFHNAGWSPLYGLRTREAKYIQAPTPEFYDLKGDPKEQRNLGDSRPQVAELSKRLAELQAGWGDTPGTLRELTDDERSRLESLGYVGMKSSASPATLADPKSMIKVFNDGARAEDFYMGGQYEAAATAAEKVVAECADCVQAIRVLAFSYLRLGRSDEAIALLRERSQALGDRFLMRSLAQALIVNSRFDEAGRVLDAYAQLEPRDGNTDLMRGDMLAMQGRTQAAELAYERASALDPGRVGPAAIERIQRLKQPAAN